MNSKLKDNMKKSILLTGANGFLGTQIALCLLKHDYKIITLIRAKNKSDAENKLYRAWWEFPKLSKEISKQISVVNGDITQENLGMEKEVYDELIHTVTHIIHAAADWNLRSSLENLQKVNIEGTKNLIKFANLIHKNHKLERFSHVSTAYVAGKKEGIIYEDYQIDDSGFLSYYEETKFKSEIEVKKADFDTSIFRPSMIVGHSSTGYIKTFNTLYVPLKFYLKKKLNIIPVSKSMKANFVPVDYVANAIVDITFDNRGNNKIFHLTSPNDALPTMEELANFVKNWADENLDIKLNTPVYISLNEKSIQRIKSLFELFKKKPNKLIEDLNILSPYFNENREYIRNNTEEILGPYKYNWEDFLPKILEFAIYHGFFHRSDRTVHEQALFRLKSDTNPINYYNIIGNEFEKHFSKEIYQDIISASKSIISMKTSKGDKIAIVGDNSTRYLTIDIAIGLTNNISVPLYYTSPLSEIKEILEDSGANILFVGSLRILKELKLNNLDITIVSFCNETIDLPSNFISWEEFLKMGENKEYILDGAVNFNDIATIRYSSGSTGKPRGVIFTHGNLRWMAEFIASMVSWSDRINKISYMSFLPLNHVVEGIMGIYSPYYAPTTLNLYFLRDFHELEKSIGKVKPKIFFSVPRFYEKIWQSVQESKIGRIYLNSNYINSNKILKKILGKIIKRKILKKTGLAGCSQLIVGSAPISYDLLKSFREIGIEVYNAYGLTEAPLLTINPIGKNELGTVGKPINSTSIKIDSVGEILAKGPQVTPGYLKNVNNDLNTFFKDKWLCTGDFGYIDSEGNLVINGRKKEVIINSYGKNINPTKIEVMFKSIPGIEEAMVIGDGKPYCTIILWSNEIDKIKNIDISEFVKNINKDLSRVEEIKKWVILSNDLSIGIDLTANFKLKRNSVTDHYKHVIDFMYDSKNEIDNMIDFGSIEV